MSSQTDRLNTALVGRYRIERELGAGGMATVYAARDVRHERMVAMKEPGSCSAKPPVARVGGKDEPSQPA